MWGELLSGQMADPKNRNMSRRQHAALVLDKVQSFGDVDTVLCGLHENIPSAGGAVQAFNPSP